MQRACRIRPACAARARTPGARAPPVGVPTVHSLHEVGSLHAAARAVGGCPVYVSDKPGQHDIPLLRRLVLPDGSVLRGQLPGRPTRDCLFSDVSHHAYMGQLALVRPQRWTFYSLGRLSPPLRSWRRPHRSSDLDEERRFGRSEFSKVTFSHPRTPRFTRTGGHVRFSHTRRPLDALVTHAALSLL